MSRPPRAEIHVRPLVSGDRDQVIALWQAAFGKSLHPDVWQWKFQGVFGNRCMVAEHANGQLIAMFGGVPYQAHCQGRRVEIVHLWDNMSHPQYRGLLGGRRGVYVRTIDAFLEAYCGDGKVVFLYGFPGERHFRLGQLTQNYGRLEGGVACLQGNVPDISLPARVARVERLMDPDGRLDGLAALFDRQLPFWVRRDRRFIEWRYFRHPQRQYRVYVGRKRWRRDYTGLMVLTGAAEPGLGVVVDFMLPQDRQQALAFLAGMWMEWQWLGWQTVRVWLPANCPARKVWEAMGFVEIPEPFGMIATGRSFSSALDWSWASQNLFYTMGDGDLF